MRLKPYEKYKPSGVEWLGDVPEHWEVKRGRFAMQVNPRATYLKQLSVDDEVSFVAMESVGEFGGLKLDVTRVIADIGSGYTEFQEGDVVLAKITPCFENVKGAIALNLVNRIAFGTTELHVLRALPSLERRFLFYVSISSMFRSAGEGEMYGSGGQKRVPSEFCENFPTPLPPLFEQRAIANFLDSKTAILDKLTAKKRDLLKRLREQRTALISRTVTKGLPEEEARAAGVGVISRFKDSGVDWLGDVPEHWEVKPLFRICSLIQTGPFGSQIHASDYVDFGTPIINPAHIIQGKIVADDESTITPEMADRLSRHRMRVGDIIFGRRGEIGRCAVVTENEAGWLCGTGSLVLRLESALSEYISILCRNSGFSQELEQHAVGTTMKNINPTILGRMIISVPPLLEQRAIANYLDRETGRIDHLITRVEAALGQLTEYRAALITAAVKGRIDVREAGSV